MSRTNRRIRRRAGMALPSRPAAEGEDSPAPPVGLTRRAGTTGVARRALLLDVRPADWRARRALRGYSLGALLMCSSLALLPAVARAQDARQIVEEAQKRTHAASERYEGALQVIDARGKIADKQWIFTRLGSHGRSKSVLRFTAPAEVKGVALLVVNHPDRASDQWMWTPAIERDRRIALQDRSTRFFGTDFSFEDLEERDVDQYDYRMIGDDIVAGVPAGTSSRVRSRRRRRNTRCPASGSGRTTTRSHRSRTT